MTPSKKSLQAILLFGPPGSGKGTQADLLAAYSGFYHLDSSRVLEAWFRNVKDEEYVEVEGKKYYAGEERKLWEGGVLMSPPVVVHLMQEEIRHLHESGRNIVTSGSLRTLYEAEHLYPVLKTLYGEKHVMAYFIELDADQSIHRNSHRRICELMRHSILSNEETKNLTICPVDGSKLLRREGLDDAETIKIRLKEYTERTEPVLEYLRSEGCPVGDVIGERSVADVFRDINNL